MRGRKPGSFGKDPGTYRNRFQKYYYRNRFLLAKKRREVYEERRRLGLCIRCGQPIARGLGTTLYCDNHIKDYLARREEPPLAKQ